ncbi:hypothetical protein B0J13DRAFT_672536 [Dactylonectria estremocensis]|uniref:Uncharacterized protein n=1 Tax=Dactylonectria estremocensis TaxID=1079267 RepID=A0A9P9F679_9HYPO|nr:hypothetical protein B0J13DRAFT_672536 [Dactylonectria estremocensis]
MEVEVEDTATKPRKTEDEDEDEDEEEGEEDDIGDSVPAFDMEAIQHHAILDATMPLPSRQFPATDTASEHSDNDEPDADADPTPSGPRDRSTYAYVHEIPPAKESTQEEIAARPKLKLKPRFRGIQLSSPATLAGPSQEHHAESEHEEEERDPKRPYYGRNSQLLTMSEKGKQAKFDAEWAAKLEAEMVAELEAELNNDTQAGSSQQSDTTKQDVKGKRKAEEGFGPLADYDRLGATETWDSLDDDFLEQFRDPATPTPAPRPQSDQMETESPQDQQDTTPISGPSEKKPRKPFERERY